MTCIDSGLVALAGALITPVSLYEPDIYGAIPLWSWVAALLSLVVPIATYSVQLLRRGLSEGLVKWLVVAYVSANVIFLLLPWSRYPAGYDRWDSWYHLAEATYVTKTGHTTSTNIYPATHLLLAMFAGSTGIPLRQVFSAAPALMSGFFLLSAYAASTWAKIESRQRFLVVLAVSALQIVPAVFPIAFSFVYIVWIIGFFLALAPQLGRFLLLLILFAALVITHLLSAISVVVGLVAIAIFFGRKSPPLNRFSIVSAVLVLSWIFWFTQAYASPTLVIADIISTGTFRSREYSQILAGVGLSGIGALIVVAAITLARVAAILLGLPGFVRGMKWFFSRSVTPESMLFSWAGANLIVFLILGSLFGAGTIGDIVDRFVSYGLLPVGFLAAYGFVRTSIKHASRVKRSVLTTLVLGCVLAVGQVAYFYPAPGTARYNWEAGTTDFHGLSWVADYIPPDKLVAASNDNSAMLTALVGRDEATKLGFTMAMKLPSHLGCDPSSGGPPDFMIVTSFDIFVLGRRGDIRQGDLDCVSKSAQLNTVYDNGALRIFARRDS